MSEVIDIRKNKKSDNFNNKAKILGLSLEKQVEILNKNYEGLMKFEITNTFLESDKTSISLIDINENVRILELPEVENLIIHIVSLQSNNVITLKLPKTMKQLAWWNLSSFRNLKNLWIWDDTVMIGEKPLYSQVERVFIQSTTGGKTKVINV